MGYDDEIKFSGLYTITTLTSIAIILLATFGFFIYQKMDARIDVLEEQNLELFRTIETMAKQDSEMLGISNSIVNLIGNLHLVDDNSTQVNITTVE